MGTDYERKLSSVSFTQRSQMAIILKDQILSTRQVRTKLPEVSAERRETDDQRTIAASLMQDMQTLLGSGLLPRIILFVTHDMDKDAGL